MAEQTKIADPPTARQIAAGSGINGDGSAVLAAGFARLINEHLGDDAGLFLKGVVISVSDREFAEKNRETKIPTGRMITMRQATISDGKEVYYFSVSDDKGPLPEIPPFSVASIKVDYCKSEAGQIKVYGELLLK